MKNSLLAGLPADDRRAVIDAAEFTEFSAGTVLQAAGPHHVYFPTSGAISLLSPTGSASCALEIGLGTEKGLFGAWPQPEGAPALAGLVTTTGAAWCIRASALERIAVQRAALRRMLELYAQVAMVQAARSAGCLSAHGSRQRLARWLLAHSDSCVDILVSHTRLAALLGARRSTVTDVINEFAADGCLRAARGHIVVLARDVLLSNSCTCYAEDGDTYRALMGMG